MQASTTMLSQCSVRSRAERVCSPQIFRAFRHQLSKQAPSSTGYLAQTSMSWMSRTGNRQPRVGRSFLCSSLPSLSILSSILWATRTRWCLMVRHVWSVPYPPSTLEWVVWDICLSPSLFRYLDVPRSGYERSCNGRRRHRRARARRGSSMSSEL